jgi:hypothetical protein
MLYGVKEIWRKRGGLLIPVNKGAALTGGGVRRAARVYIDIKLIEDTVKFNISIGGSHPNPSPHIRLSIATKYFSYKQGYGDYSIDFVSGTGVTTLTSTSRGTHDVTIEAVNMPVPATIGLIQNTINAHSTSNYLYTYVGGVLADTQFWSDDDSIGVSMSPEDYTPTPVLRLNRADGQITYERLLPPEAQNDSR